MSLTRVKPAYRHLPEGIVETFGPEVVDLCTDVGFEPDEDQAEILDGVFAINQRGLPAAFEYAVIAARQNLKTAVLEQAALGWMFVTDQRLIVWSSHEMGTTLEAMQDLENLITNNRILSKNLPADRSGGIIHKNGHEAIRLKNGQRIKFKARTSGGGRGLSGDKIILDEGYAVTSGMLGSLMPTLTTRPEAQIVWGSSAGHLISESLRAVRDRGRAGNDPDLGYTEYCAPTGGCALEMCSHEQGTEGCALDNPENWKLANPATGRRITLEYIAKERKSLSPAEFARERLGWWEDPPNEEGSAIGGDQWNGLQDPSSKPLDPVSFGLYVSKDRTKVAIGVAGYRSDGRIHVGVVPAVRGSDVDSLPGTGWIADRMAQLWSEWSPSGLIIADDSGAASLLPELQKKSVRATSINTKEVSRNAVRFYDAVSEDQIRHQGAPALGRSVVGAKWADIGDSKTWDRKDELSDITQLMSVTLALHGLVNRKTPMIHVWND